MTKIELVRMFGEFEVVYGDPSSVVHDMDNWGYAEATFSFLGRELKVTLWEEDLEEGQDVDFSMLEDLAANEVLSKIGKLAAAGF